MSKKYFNFCFQSGFNRLMWLPIVVVLLMGGSAQAAKQTYSAGGSFTVPAGVTEITVEAWGGGGHGGERTTNGGGGGGGGGAYARSTILVTPNTTYYFGVGSGAVSGNNTTPGGDSCFGAAQNGNNAIVRAKGGASVGRNTATGAGEI